MSKVMLINVTHAEESRVAIVADGTLVSFEIESFSREHLKGNIYKAVVHRVQPGLEAAFVDIGADRDAFLPLDEICFRHLAAPPPRNGGGGGGNGERRRPRIQDILKPGEEILVQIVKEQFGTKPPTLSTFYSLPGRFLVLLPGSDDAGISRRIEGADRVRIRELIEKLHPPDGFGIIVRTVAGFDPGVNDLQRDMTYLLRLWESIQQAAGGKRGPALVYREHDLVLRNIRDYFTPDIDEIHVDNEEVFLRAREFLRDVMPEKESALQLYQGDKPIFSHFNVEGQIESIYKRRVHLKSGGYIVIDGTEALTAIDVNSGRSVRSGSQEETAFRTNIEAAVEIARQLRLRDQGGLIVIDFIDMRNPQHIGEVEKALRTAMFEDKARHEVGRISHFGLLEVSRQRLRPAAAATSYVACPMCDGHGLVRTTESAALVALRKVHNRIAQGDVGSLKVAVPNDVAMYLLNQKREDLAELERRYATRIQVVLSSDLMPHQSEIDVKPRVEGDSLEQPQLRLGGVAAPEVAPAPEAAPQAAEEKPAEAQPSVGATAPATGDAKRRRRRGRRRGRGRQAATALGDALATLAGPAGLEVSEPASPGEAGTPVGDFEGEGWDAEEPEEFGEEQEGYEGASADVETVEFTVESAAAAPAADEVQAESDVTSASPAEGVVPSPEAEPAHEATPETGSAVQAAEEAAPSAGRPRGRRSRGGRGSRKRPTPGKKEGQAAPKAAKPTAPKAAKPATAKPKKTAPARSKSADKPGTPRSRSRRKPAAEPPASS